MHADRSAKEWIQKRVGRDQRIADADSYADCHGIFAKGDGHYTLHLDSKAGTGTPYHFIRVMKAFTDPTTIADARGASEDGETQTCSI